MYKRKTIAWFCSECSHGDGIKGNIAKHIKSRHDQVGHPIGPYPATLSVDTDMMKKVRSQMSNHDTTSNLPQHVGQLSEYAKAHYMYTITEYIPTFADDKTTTVSRVRRTLEHIPHHAIQNMLLETKTFDDISIGIFRILLGDMSVDDNKILWKFGESPIYGILKSFSISIEDESHIREYVMENHLITFFEEFLVQISRLEDSEWTRTYEHIKKVLDRRSSVVLINDLDKEFWKRLYPYIPTIHVNPIDFTQNQVIK